MFIKETLNALIACLISFIICAVAYPAATWGLSQVLFPRQAEGSLVYGRDHTVIGSELIAQPFSSDGYFHPRPSAAGANGYAADAASGSNLATKNPALRLRISIDVARQLQQHTGDPGLKALLDRLDADQAELKTKNEIAEKSEADTKAIAALEQKVGTTQTEILDASVSLGKEKDRLVPVDLVTTSGSGLDPDISPEAARYQANRVASARQLPVDRVLDLIEKNINFSGAIIGAPPRINVLQLNRALDEEKPAPAASVSSAAEEVKPTSPADSAQPTAGPADSGSPRPADASASLEAQHLAGDLAALRARVGGLSSQLEVVSQKIGASRDDKPAAGLKDLEDRVAALSESAARASTLSEQVGRIDNRVNSVGEKLQQLQSEFGETRASLKTLEEQAIARLAPGAAAETPHPTADRSEASVASAIDLRHPLTSFRQGQYAEAEQAFRTLTRAYPDDARVWYYAALANGMKTGQWSGSILELVNKGIERERAGTPKMSEIDAVVSDLTHGTGRDWLAFYRRRAGAH